MTEEKKFKVSIVLLNYHERTEHTQQVKDVNLNNAGHPLVLIEIDRLGVAAALNEGIQKAMANGSDAVVTMANDIILPNDWLKKMVEYTTAVTDTGMCGIHVVEALPPTIEINGVNIHKIFTAFGNVMIPRRAIETIGFFNTDFDPYSTNDADYAYRLNACGFINYYIPGLRANHIGNDIDSQTPYRKMKWDGLAAGAQKWGYWTGMYERTENFFVPYDQTNYIIDMKQYEGEGEE